MFSKILYEYFYKKRSFFFLKQKFVAKKGLSAEELKEQEAKRKERKDSVNNYILFL